MVLTSPVRVKSFLPSRISYLSKAFSPSRISYLRCCFQYLFTSTSVVLSRDLLKMDNFGTLKLSIPIYPFWYSLKTSENHCFFMFSGDIKRKY